jgi:DNA-binding HxlR family transcriptional regulator
MAIENKNNSIVKSNLVEIPPEIDYTEKHERACPVSNFIELISKKWTIPIVLELYRKSFTDSLSGMRFNEISKILGDVNPRTLSQRLKELEEKGIIIREQFNEIPLRVEYTLTEKGIELGNKFLDIDNWAKNWE